jgi:hypothetical protein
MYSMHEALSRDRMRQYEEQARRSSLLREARSASRSRRHPSRQHAGMQRRSEHSGRLLAMAE